MWISEPTPVISSTKAADSGSNSSPARTSSEPVEMKVNRSTPTERSPPPRPASCSVHSNPTTKLATTVAVPSRCPHRSVRRPPSSSTAAPASGSAISSQEEASSPSAGVMSTSDPRQPSVLEQVGVVDRGGPAGPVDRHDDREADHDLGGGHDHDEEGHDL